MSKILFVQIIKKEKNRAQRERSHEVLGFSSMYKNLFLLQTKELRLIAYNFIQV